MEVSFSSDSATPRATRLTSLTQNGNSALALSESRKKRSTTNFANLRLAPLSSKYAGRSREAMAPKSPYEEKPDGEFARHHSSYLQGKSAPTTPGILSRNSSRAHMGGGLSRRGSLYDEDEEDSSDTEYAYGAVAANYAVAAPRLDGHIPKAKSEGLLMAPRHQRQMGSLQMPTKSRKHKRTLTGSNTPKNSVRPVAAEDEWLTRTCAATNALLQESKGQLWLSSRDSSTTLVQPDSTDDDDDGYEEAAAMSAISAARLRAVSANISPQMSRWSSRYGSRTNSRRTSRRGSVTSMRTPLALPGHAHSDSLSSYFDDRESVVMSEAPSITSPIHKERPDEAEVARLTANESFGLGGFVDRLMGFNLFNVEEHDETTDDDREHVENETAQEAEKRMASEAARRRQEKAKLVAPPAPQQGSNGMMQIESAGWADAAWLLSVASRVMF